MPRFRVHYAQRELRFCTLEAPDGLAALQQALDLARDDQLDAGRFELAEDQEVSFVQDDAGHQWTPNESPTTEQALNNRLADLADAIRRPRT